MGPCCLLQSPGGIGAWHRGDEFFLIQVGEADVEVNGKKARGIGARLESKRVGILFVNFGSKDSCRFMG